MDWLSNANTIASLVLALFGIGGYVYGVVTYLKKRASPLQQVTTGMSQASTPITQNPSVSYKPLSWLEWMELFAQGLVDTADFILILLQVDKEEKVKNTPVINRLGYCAAFCGIGVLFGEFILGFALGFFLVAFGVKDPSGAAVGITTILLFMTFSLIYIYHVGLAVEMKQLEKYQEIIKQSTKQ
jgi:hypothetical protein